MEADIDITVESKDRCLDWGDISALRLALSDYDAKVTGSGSTTVKVVLWAEIDSITDINEIIRDTIQDGWPTTIELTGTIRFEEVFA